MTYLPGSGFWFSIPYLYPRLAGVAPFPQKRPQLNCSAPSKSGQWLCFKAEKMERMEDGRWKGCLRSLAAKGSCRAGDDDQESYYFFPPSFYLHADICSSPHPAVPFLYLDLPSTPQAGPGPSLWCGKIQSCLRSWETLALHNNTSLPAGDKVEAGPRQGLLYPAKVCLQDTAGEHYVDEWQ